MWAGDCRELAGRLKPASVDLILTDPPYPRRDLACFEALAEVARRVLRPGGWLVSLCGHYQVDAVLRAMRCEELSYRWITALLSTGRRAKIWGWRINACFKPGLVWQRGSGKPHGWWDDMQRTDDADWRSAKARHVWGQPVAPLKKMIGALCPDGGTVLDPFGGGGSVALAALQERRRSITAEIDPAAAAAIVRHLEAARAARAASQATTV